MSFASGCFSGYPATDISKSAIFVWDDLLFFKAFLFLISSAEIPHQSGLSGSELLQTSCTIFFQISLLAPFQIPIILPSSWLPCRCTRFLASGKFRIIFKSVVNKDYLGFMYLNYAPG